jgi:hypothetical protein
MLSKIKDNRRQGVLRPCSKQSLDKDKQSVRGAEVLVERLIERLPNWLVGLHQNRLIEPFFALEINERSDPLLHLPVPQYSQYVLRQNHLWQTRSRPRPEWLVRPRECGDAAATMASARRLSSESSASSPLEKFGNQLNVKRVLLCISNKPEAPQTKQLD